MSHKDYSKISTTPAVAVVEEENDDILVTPAVVEDVIEPEISEPIEGFVSGCEKLNVREEPKKDADIVCVIEKDASVIIDVDDSTDSFYKVCTEAGAEGYCMKNFITITQ